MSYYSDMFGSVSIEGDVDICDVVKNKISTKTVEVCSKEILYEEFKEAIMQMQPLKAHDLNGIPTLFFQKYWHIFGNEVVMLVLNILNNGKSSETMNKIFIFIIPKGKNPSSPKDFRLISLFNVIMKIVTKCIATILKTLLPNIIGEEQSAFVMGRKITNNDLITMECFHWLKKKTRGKK